MSSTRLVTVIPAKNEEKTIGKVIDGLKDRLSEQYDLVFVVSSSSSDKTDEIAREKGAEVIRDGGTGLGEAMFRGIKKALEYEPDLIMSIDADLQFQPDEVEKLLEKSSDTDLVLGSRFLESGVKYRMSISHRIGNRLLNSIVNNATGLDLTDAQTGYRVMKPEVAEELRTIGRHTYVQETIIDAYSNGFTIEEVPVEFHERQKGGSRVVRSISRYAIRTLPVILHRSGYTPYLTNMLSAAAAVISVFSVILGVVFRNLTPALLGILLGLVSIQMFFFGMFLDSELP